MVTSIPAGGAIWPNRTVKPWANMRSAPGFRFAAISASKTAFWDVSGTRIMTTSAARVASATSITRSPASAAIRRLFEAGASPTTTSTPDSRRLSAWACPWLPNPMIATTWSASIEGSASAS